jgi:phage portal protein BeeE
LASLLRRVTGGERGIVSIDDYIGAVNQYGFQPSVTSTMPFSNAETIATSFAGYAAGGMSNSIVFSCLSVRQLVFSSVRLRYQRLKDGKPSDMFGTPDLSVLEHPAPGETTQDLLSRMIQDADLAGNAYHVLDTPLTRLGGDDTSKNVLRLRPDWIYIVTRKRMRPSGQLGWQRVGYVYFEGGKESGNDPVPLLLDEVSHFAPTPDPLASFRGMSWLTPVVREIENDSLMNTHKRRFLENGATPNMIITHAKGADRDAILAFDERMKAQNAGVANAGKTLNLYPGADATIVGSNMKELDFKAVQGAGELRISAAAQVPPVLLGLTEAKYAEYPHARRRFADGTMHPLWASAAGALGQIMPTFGKDSRLWYDADDIPFLREDEKDAAEITQTRATTLASLISAGFTPESAAKFLMTADDFRVLEHTGLYSVQLQKPGEGMSAADARAVALALLNREV